MDMEPQYVIREEFDQLKFFVESMKDNLIGCRARMEALSIIAASSLQFLSDEQRQALASTVRMSTENALALYDDDPHGQSFRANIAANIERWLRQLRDN
ncbi:hypothetical protein CS344_20175 [Bordetella bronchiseptica]|nr:hypothetical protein CS344_20175 [Bordetella bronchiseptica]KDB68551.1 hypothetical protein AZ15_2426 [Bordetella bronchiseptica A1-7]KDB70719.1 hypothetical protein AZ21_1753 [Bordetella bronchiseptica B20-10725633]QBS70768.1 hypothetical protein B2C13_19865 [Bordetella bronchiseptica]